VIGLTKSKREEAKQKIAEIVRERNLAMENLAEEKFVEVLMQAIECRDFQSCLSSDGEYFGISYVPYRRVQELERKVKELRGNIEEISELIHKLTEGWKN